jgi:predicted phage baseplate assembly protein
MALPAPNLDDRRFQQLVDEAKRYVQQHCPEWTDHNVSDPGVTLIETFAHMVDQLLYRLNRVPDRNYLAFLDLLGVRLFPPVAATAEVTFWLSAPQPEVVILRAGTEVATVRTETEEAAVFATTDDLTMPPCSLVRLVTRAGSTPPVDRTDQLRASQDVPVFGRTPTVDDTMLVGLSRAVPRCAAVIRLDSQVEGIGVDPRQPPLVWEAWDGSGWIPCEVDEDTTGGLNRPGEVTLHVPAAHTAAVVSGVRAGWLRCRLVEPRAGQPFYSETPTVRSAEAFTIGGTTTVRHAETVTDVALGEAAGVPGQRFYVPRTPVLLDDPVVLQVSSPEGWQDWHVVDYFSASNPTDRHVALDASRGEFAFGPAVRQPDGTLRHYGAVPPEGARIRVPSYRTGGGRAGNVARGAISVLRSSVPYVSRVNNRWAAHGGVDGETVAEAKLRGPLMMRTQDRAVTAADYEQLAAMAAPAMARLRCMPASETDAVGTVRLLVVPDAVADEGDRLRIEQLDPVPEVLETISRELDKRRPIGARLVVEPAYYQGVTVVVRVRSRAGEPAEVRRAALAALYRHLNPLRGGPDGMGWPFGRPVQLGEVHAVLTAVPEIDLIHEVRLFAADPLTGQRGEATDHVEIPGNALVFSYEHQVNVVTE